MKKYIIKRLLLLRSTISYDILVMSNGSRQGDIKNMNSKSHVRKNSRGIFDIDDSYRSDGGGHLYIPIPEPLHIRRSDRSFDCTVRRYKLSRIDYHLGYQYYPYDNRILLCLTCFYDKKRLCYTFILGFNFNFRAFMDA